MNRTAEALGIDPLDLRRKNALEPDYKSPAGLVVTSYLHHATPAAFYAHVSNRGQTDSITCDMVRSDIDLLFGGGRKALSDTLPEAAHASMRSGPRAIALRSNPRRSIRSAGFPCLPPWPNATCPQPPNAATISRRPHARLSKLLSADNDKGILS